VNDERGDRELVRGTLAGDVEAFAVLHKRYYARIYRLAYFRTRSQADAEDVAAETFVKAIAHLASYRFQGESLYPWLARIASNLVADLGRRQSGMTAISLDAPAGESVRALIEGLAGTDPDPHTLAERGETQAIVRNAILSLPRDQSEAVLLRYLGDMPLKEIADAMGKTEGAIKSLLHRALLNLRRALSDVEGEAANFADRRARATEQATNQAGERAAREQEAARWSGLEIDDG
jgi:RNA polymerase sigma-70 factor, ECF subfamily